MATKNADFPTYANHAAAKCFQRRCQHSLVDPVDSGFPVGNGAFKAACPACGLMTWYDVQATPSDVLRKAFRRPTDYDSDTIRKRVTADATRIPGAVIWPNGIGFDLGRGMVCYADGRPWLVFSGQK
jgi:hypothetical protein